MLELSSCCGLWFSHLRVPAEQRGDEYTGYNFDTNAPLGVTDPDGATTTYAYGDDLFPDQPTTTTKAAVSGNPNEHHHIHQLRLIRERLHQRTATYR